MDINISIGQHENLVDVLAQIKNHPQNKDVFDVGVDTINIFLI